MGEIAEMMLDGTMCSRCGDFIGEDTGYPTLCGACAADEGNQDQSYESKQKKSQREKCPICGARKVNVFEHAKVKHPKSWPNFFYNDGELFDE